MTEPPSTRDSGEPPPDSGEPPPDSGEPPPESTELATSDPTEPEVQVERSRFQAFQDRLEAFWHDEVRVERLALVRIAFGVALLTDQLFQYLPYFGYLFGPEGVAPAGINDGRLLRTWRWTAAFFNTDDQTILGVAFALWVLSTLALTVGFKTKIAAVLTWLLTMCFFWRNTAVKNGGDDIIQIALFLFLWAPVAAGLSLDARKKPSTGTVAAWPVRLFQLQMCAMYWSTGVAKLKGGFGGTWAQGTSLHYVLNDAAMIRWSYAQWPMPIWMSAPMSYLVLIFEVLFPLLVLVRPIRVYVLWYGVLFHLAIFLTMEVGWFSFYSLAMYPAWLTDRFLVEGRHQWVARLRTAIVRLRSAASRLRPARS